jgi:hypothetical protein
LIVLAIIYNLYKKIIIFLFIYLFLSVNVIFCQRLAFLFVSNARTKKLYIFRQCTFIVYFSCTFITTNVVSSNPVHDEVYSIQYYMIKCVSDIRQIGGSFWLHPPINLNLAEILLRATVVSTINQTNIVKKYHGRFLSHSR